MAQALFPEDSADLLDSLDETHPPRCKLPTESLEDHLRYAGARELIDKLRAWQHMTDNKAKERRSV